ncbi:sensor histidine kinase [Psychrobacillus sp. FSL K6-4615]|uniref:sensor histidine kinase n=1 Tax=Psychrobacillus sp. FSL K6-4615 TaxID=2921551 RepID=UPI0030F8B452
MRLFLLYIKERFSWILFFSFLQLWLNILLTLDVNFTNTSILYMNSTNLLLFLVFFLWRYFRETKFIKNVLKVNRGDSTFDQLIARLPDGQSLFDKMMMDEIQEIIQSGKHELNGSHILFLEEKDQTLSWIHEMKTPLTSMKLMIDNVEDSILKKQLEVEWLRMHMLLDQQLHKTRLPFIEKDNVIEKVNLQKVIFREIKELKPWCMQRNIGFETEGLDKTTLTDHKWLAFIVRQIVSNAVKYSKEHKEIHISTTIDNLGHLVLSIKDEGVGISQADLPRIFEKSFTGRVGRESAASTGMGLYLAKNSAEKLGININVTSEIGVGSTFSLQFPIQNEMQEILGR